MPYLRGKEVCIPRGVHSLGLLCHSQYDIRASNERARSVLFLVVGVEVGSEVVVFVGSVGSVVVVVDDGPPGTVDPVVVVDVATVVLEERVVVVMEVVLELGVDDEHSVHSITPKSMSRRSSPSSRVT